MLKNLPTWLRQHFFLILLIIFAVAVRLPKPLSGTISFQFDQGKDLVAVMHMIKTFKPALIGPWTSIPGLYFGPGWYYLLAPAMIISNGNPIAPVYLMIGLIVLQIILAFRYFGKLEAIVISCAPLWLIISSSAWNPFPMTLISILILIGLQQARKRKVLTPKIAAVLGLSAGLGFHFSTAFAIFYPPIILASLLIRKVKIQPKVWLVLLITFLVPFIPQALFEVRHQFLEVKAVVNYITEGRKKDVSDATKASGVIETIWNESKIAVLPEVWSSNQMIYQGTGYLSIGLLIIGLVLAGMKKKVPSNWIEIILFFIIPVPFFFILHFNLWYILGLIPPALLFGMFAIRQLPKPVQYFFVLMLLATPLTLYMRSQTEQKKLSLDVGELPIKIQAMEAVRKRAGGQPYASYHYVSDIYDYTYQYLYLNDGFHGITLPTEFSYQPGEIAYVEAKVDLLNKLSAVTPKEPPKYNFYLIEGELFKDSVADWWGRQRYGKYIEKIEIGERMTIIVTTPAGSEPSEIYKL